MPFFSVIVPIYNTQDYVEDCLRSLLEQTFDGFEVICVNDGSTDQSFQKAQAVAAGDERFKFFEQENAGLSAARNTGLAHAQGDYVCFLDSDDCYTSDALAKLYLVLADQAQQPLDVLDFSAATFYETDGMREVHEEEYGFRQDIPGAMSGAELFTQYWQKDSYASSACFHAIRKAFLDEQQLRFKEGLLHEDELFTPMLYPYAQAAAYLNEPLYLRRVRPDSIMSRGRGVKNLASLRLIVNELREWFRQHGRDFDKDFVQAFAKDIGVLEGTMMFDLTLLTEEEFNQFLADLSEEEKADLLVLNYYGYDFATRLRWAEGEGLLSKAMRTVRRLRPSMLARK